MKAYELNRKTYEKVKKMDHGQMKSFYERVYMRGFEAGKRAAEGLSDLRGTDKSKGRKEDNGKWIGIKYI